MTELTYRPPTEDDIADVASRMRVADVLEVAASCAHTPLSALIESIRASDLAVCIVLDGKPEGILGFAYKGGLAAEVWLLGTDALDHIPRKMLVEGRRITDAWAKEAAVLHNFVSVDHDVSIRWLKAIGFTIAESPTPYGPFGMPHYYFWKTAHV